MEDIKIGRKERARKKKVEGKEDKHKGIEKRTKKAESIK